MMTSRRAALLAGIVLAGAAVRVGAQSPVDSCVARFYQRRGNRPAWISENGVSTQATQLLTVVAQADREGLEPADYRTAALDSLLGSWLVAEEVWRFDSLLTYTFFAYALEVSRGRVLPTLIDTQWTATTDTTDLVDLLERALAFGQVAATLRHLPPPQAGYVALRAELATYRRMAERGDWPTTLPERLAAEGYDLRAGLEAAVRRFQARHGLETDGIVGPHTQAALDVPAATRARQIALNLERWRWLPRFLGERYIVVNGAAFMLDVVESGIPVLTMRAIVGRPDSPTPIVSARATHLVFRPAWNVPRTIAVQDLLPLLQRDRVHAARNGIRVFGDSSLGGRELDSRAIDWTAVTDSTFTYRLLQEPGPDNPLGSLKLVFWTPFSVFIHDTPSQPLFGERWRALSHGCVRVEEAATLASHLLPSWPRDSIRAAMSRGRDNWVRLPGPLLVHLVYWTAWVDHAGQVNFRGDPYAWDTRLAAALESTRAPLPVTVTETL